VDLKTQRRGPADTNNRRFAKLLAVSLLLHVPFTPWAALIGLLRLWSPVTDDTPSPPITAIPIDLIEDQAPPGPPEPEPAAAAPPSDEGTQAPPKPKPKPKPVAESIHDAGAPDAKPDAEADEADAGNDGGLADAGKVQAAHDAGADAGAGDAGPSDAGARPLSEPVALGGAKQVADANANVRMYIYTDHIRDSAVGARIGRMLRKIPQWRDFFGPTAIDPVHDLDQIFIAGPQLRDTSNVVAILKHHVPAARMRAAIDALVRADKAGGEWLDAGVPAAAAHADGAERRFVMANAQTVIVTPPSAYGGALAAGKRLTLPPSPGPEALMMYLATPWRAFIGLPVEVPHSIKWARIRITPQSDGGATAEIEAEDENPVQANDDAAYLSRSANALASLNLGFLGSILGQSQHRFIERINFSAQGSKIKGDAMITADQLSTALDFAEAFMDDRAARHPRVPPPAPSTRVP